MPPGSGRPKPAQRLLKENNLEALYFHRDALLHAQSSSLRQFGRNVCPWWNRWCRGRCIGYCLCSRLQMTRATKRSSVGDVRRRNESFVGHNVQHASQAMINVTRLLYMEGPVDSLSDHSVIPVMQRTMTGGLSHGLSEAMIERLLKRNDVVLLMERDQRVCRVPYRGKQSRSDVLRFLRIAGLQVRAFVYSHHAEDGAVWIDVMSGEVSAL